MIAFEAGADVGLGHALRCRVLAHAFARRGHEMSILCRGPASVLSSWDWPSGSAMTSDDSSSDPVSPLAAMIERSHPEWVVLDGYNWWPTGIVETLQRRSVPVLAFDDAGEGPQAADLILNQNAADVDGATGSRSLRGLQFALIDDPYVEARARRRLKSGALSRILVSFGGADRAGHTQRLIDALDRQLAEDAEIDVVIGPFFSDRPIVSARHRLNFHRDLRHLAVLMEEADLLVAGAGTTCWQGCCVGVPILAVVTASNQEQVATTLMKHQAAWIVSDSKIESESLWRDIEDREHRAGVAEAARALIDGGGGARVVKAVEAYTRNAHWAGSAIGT